MGTEKTITRRDFVKGVAYQAVGTAIGLTVADAVLSQFNANTAWGLSSSSSRVVIVRDRNVLDTQGEVDKNITSRMLDNAIKALTGKNSANLGWQSLFSPSDSVGIKTSSNMMPTNQVLVDAIRKNLEKTGVDFSKTKVADKDAFSFFENCNALINVPGLKTHWLSGIAASLKNYINLALVPSVYHPDSCASLGKIWTKPIVAKKTRLIVVDALQALFNGGPQVDPRYVWDYRGFIVGQDPVAVDMVCLQILQSKRNDYKKEFWEINPPPKHIELADKEYHLGNSNLKDIELIKIGWEEEFLL